MANTVVVLSNDFHWVKSDELGTALWDLVHDESFEFTSVKVVEVNAPEDKVSVNDYGGVGYPKDSEVKSYQMKVPEKLLREAKKARDLKDRLDECLTEIALEMENQPKIED